jgi:hypothetical protein
MAKSSIYLLFVLLVANIFGIGIMQAELNPDTDNLLFENSIIKIVGIDPTAYPKIKVNIFIDELCAATGNLVQDDFTVEEDGTRVAIDSFYFTGRASGQKLDLAVVFDETDTMADEIRAMKSNVDDLTNKIKASNIDARYSLVTFKEEVLPKIESTDDPEVFKREVNQLRAYGGFYQRPEDSLGGVAKALSFGFRPDAQKIIIVITDEPSMQRGDGWSNSTYHQDDVQQDLLDAGVMLVAVSPDFRSGTIPSNIPRSYLPLYADMRELAQSSGGLWIDIYSADFSVILDQLEDIITGTYVIEYSSPATTTTGGRTVAVSVNAPDCVQGITSSTYIPPASPTVPNRPPIIFSLDSDKASPQESGSIITWTVETGDPDGDQVLYRFFLDDEPMTDWTTEKTWTWEAKDSGSYRIEAHVRDGKHAGPNGLDDRMLISFDISLLSSPTIREISFMEFNRTFGGDDSDSINSAYPTSDGGYILAGTTQSYGSGNRDAWLIKTDAQGNELWNKTFGGVYDDWGRSALPTSDGGYIMVGSTRSFRAENTDTWLIKTDSQGQEVWNRIFGGANTDEALSVQHTDDGGYILAGWTASFGKGAFDAWLIKTDSQGREVWSRTFGGTNTDVAHSVQQTSDSGYILAGRTNTYGAGDFDAWLIKTDPEGQEVWNKTFGGAENDWAVSVQPTQDGGYILGGATKSYSAVNTDAWLIRTDARGIKLWDKTFGGTGIVWTNMVQPTLEGGYIISAFAAEIEPETQVGASNGAISLNQKNSFYAGGGDTLLIKTDSQGQELWSKTFGGVSWDMLYSVHHTFDGGYILAGETSSFGAGDMDAWLIKVNSEGNIAKILH